jgi:glycosyltransferase involved in cell wall biosynthesis
MQNRHKVFFLYLEIAGYVESCLKKLVSKYPVDVHLVRYPPDPNAPFRFEEIRGVTYYNRKNYDRKGLTELAGQIQPAIIFCNGWIDKDYVAVAKRFHHLIPTVLSFDNIWKGTFRQQLATLTAPWVLPRIFSHCWVPGEPQKTYAQKLGFVSENIRTGMYSANYELFDGYYRSLVEQKKESFPRRFVYVGRYLELKGVRELWDAFLKLQDESPNEWELWCIGKGSIEDDFPKHERMRNVGFVQPADMKQYLAGTGVFIMPSRSEHWGVAVHEFAIAGYPLILSSNVPAGSAFLREGQNGFYHAAGDAGSLASAMKRFISLSDEQLYNMGELSHNLSQSITPDIWADTAWSFITPK